jgi:hypothetical protein
VLSLGLENLAAADFFLTQMGVLTGTGLLFLCSLVACMMAFRAAGSARRSRIEAAAHYESAQSLAAEIRHMAAQAEFAARSPAERESYGDNSQADYPEEAIVELSRDDRADLAAGEAALEAAKRAAIEPSALLRGRRRRR